MTKLPEHWGVIPKYGRFKPDGDAPGTKLYTEAQMLQFRRDALEEALQCYSQDDTASDYIGKILDLKDET